MKMEERKQRKVRIIGEKVRKIFLHKVGYNGFSKRLTLPVQWCLENDIVENDHLIIIQRKRSLEIMTKAEFERLYLEIKDCPKGYDYSSTRW